MSLQSVFSGLFQSKGLKRTVAATLAGLSLVSTYFPQTAPYAEGLAKLAGYFGIVGVAHAAVSN